MFEGGTDEQHEEYRAEQRCKKTRETQVRNRVLEEAAKAAEKVWNAGLGNPAHAIRELEE
jgi:hypothetical protein